MDESAILATKAPRVPYATPKQLEVLRYIRHYQEEHSVSPTLEEVAKAKGVTKITIYQHVNQLERKGWLTREKFRSRSIQLLHDIPGKKENFTFSNGAIKDAQITDSDTDSDDSVKILTGAQIYFITDNSLSSKGILCGDHIIVQNIEPRGGDLVLIEMNGKVKIKTHRKEYEDHAIRGVIKGVIRPFK